MIQAIHPTRLPRGRPLNLGLAGEREPDPERNQSGPRNNVEFDVVLSLPSYFYIRCTLQFLVFMLFLEIKAGYCTKTGRIAPLLN